MNVELTTENQYRSLEERSQPELQAMAKLLGLKVPPAMGVQKLAYAIRVKQTRDRLDIEADAHAQRRADKGNPDRLPSLEEVMIFGGVFLGKTYEPSPRILYRIINNLDPGQDFPVVKGGVFLARIYPKDKKDQPLLNVLPECICIKYPDLSADASQAEKLENELKKAISLQEIGTPIWEDRPDPQDPKRMRPVIVGKKDRFSFIKVKEVPQDTSFGLYFKGDEDS